jgi:hypothetical protein
MLFPGIIGVSIFLHFRFQLDEAAGGGDVPTTPQPSTSTSGRTLSGQLSPMLSPITRRKLTPHPKKLVAGKVNLLLLVLNILIFLHFKYISFDFLAFNAQS